MNESLQETDNSDSEKISELLKSAKDSAENQIIEIDQSKSKKTAAFNVHRLYREHITDPLKALVDIIGSSKPELLKTIQAIISEIDDFGRKMSEEVKKREGVNVAGEYIAVLEKVINVVI